MSYNQADAEKCFHQNRACKQIKYHKELIPFHLTMKIFSYTSFFYPQRKLKIYLDLSCNRARLGGCCMPSLDPGLVPEKNSVDGGELLLPNELPEDPFDDNEFVLFLLDDCGSNIFIDP